MSVAVPAVQKRAACVCQSATPDYKHWTLNSKQKQSTLFPRNAATKTSRNTTEDEMRQKRLADDHCHAGMVEQRRGREEWP